MNLIRITLVASLLFLSGCFYSYSKFDPNSWEAIELSFKNYIIEYSLPIGYISTEPEYDSVHILAAHHYDVVTSPDVYGIRSETDIILFVTESKQNEVNDYISDNFTYQEYPKRLNWLSWKVLVAESKKHHFQTRLYIKKITPGIFLTVRVMLKDHVFTNEKLLQSRIRLGEDIVRTIKIKQF
jgi:hypothetical protein